MATAGAGNPNLDFKQGGSFYWSFLFKKGSEIRIAWPDSLHGYIGILAHEQKHENDFFDVIWQGTGYKAAEDSDGDTLRDAWETAQYTDLSKNGDYAFETSASNSTGDGVGGAWGDNRADVVALDACNADLDIDQPDWSDANVLQGTEQIFQDTDGPPDGTPLGPKQTSKASTKSNNKDHQ